MKRRKVWSRTAHVTLFVAVVSLVTIGFVLADRGNPTAVVSEGDSLARFQQYQRAIEMMEQEQNAAYAASLVKDDDSSQARFEQYQWAIEMSERAQDAAYAASLVKDDDSSQTRFEQYLGFPQWKASSARSSASESITTSIARVTRRGVICSSILKGSTIDAGATRPWAT
jgi:hypothetical protein